MSEQHAQALAVSLRGGRRIEMYSGYGPNSPTIESGYVETYLRYRLGLRRTLPKLNGMDKRTAARLRERLDEALAR